VTSKAELRRRGVGKMRVFTLEQMRAFSEKKRKRKKA
jgi:hypothetical protein